MMIVRIAPAAQAQTLGAQSQHDAPTRAHRDYTRERSRGLVRYTSG
jgi:hypothetical protein